MLDIIRNNDGSVTIREAQTRATLADFMEQYEGQREYTGVVAECQKWYYGAVIKAAWCATFLSFCMNQTGILEKNLTKKHENVYYMSEDLKNHCKEVSIKDAKRGDVVVICYDSVFKWNSKKHICVLCEPIKGGLALCIGGNQDDSVCKKYFSIENIVKVYRLNA